MPKPTEHKSVQSRILQYATDIEWVYISRTEAEQRREFNAKGISSREKAKNASRFFNDILYCKVKKFNPKFTESKEELIRMLNSPLPDIFGNRDFLRFIQGEKTYFNKEENREFNLILIDFDHPENNCYEVTEEYYLFNGRYANREDVVFLINGIPVLVIECKNATKDEAIAIGVDQIRRYHSETPEFFVPEQIFTVTESIGFSYGVTWNTVKRNIFNWKSLTGEGIKEEIGNLEAKIKSFCAKQNILDYIKKFIVFAEKDEELNKYILRQHQKTAVDKIIERAHEKKKTRGLIWHTQGSGKPIP
ncbi:MAG: type I restriction endonuclease subunit R [Bacteroidales bacterium]|nr:type I restriction endonuclease subunit R [Bacteroidales bacterium]